MQLGPHRAIPASLLIAAISAWSRSPLSPASAKPPSKITAPAAPMPGSSR